jgi:chromosomal replication initiation ATPase DnaA
MRAGRTLPTIASIQRAVADDYGVSVSDLKGPDVHRRFVRPRHTAMVLAYQLTDHSKARISSFFGKSLNTAGEAIAKVYRRRDAECHEKLRRLTLDLLRSAIGEMGR